MANAKGTIGPRCSSEFGQAVKNPLTRSREWVTDPESKASSDHGQTLAGTQMQDLQQRAELGKIGTIMCYVYNQYQLLSG